MTSVLNNVMIGFTASVSVLMIIRIAADWVRFRASIDEQDEAELRRLVKGQHDWAVRHVICAAGATAVAAYIQFMPELTGYGLLAGSIAVYGMASLVFACVETVLGQWLGGKLQLSSLARYQTSEVRKRNCELP